MYALSRPETFKRFGAEWTPTLLITDADGSERHRVEGFLAAPEALYWTGVARYKATDDGAALGETGRALAERYPDSP